MVSRFRWVAVVAAFAVMLSAGVCVYAQGPGPRSGGPGGALGRGARGFGPGPALALRELNLSDAQRQQVRDIMQRHRDENRQAADRLRTAMEAQRKAVNTVPVDEGLIRSTSQALAGAQTEMAVRQARMQSEIFAILTPEQQDKAKQLQAQRATQSKKFRNRPQ
jgi:periplasmic protein CpxP/Spy